MVSSGLVGAYIDIHGSHTSTLYIGVSSDLYQPHRTINPECTRDHRVRIATDPVVGLRWPKSSEQQWVNEAPPRSFDSAPQE
jgi:hypothetical protein